MILKSNGWYYHDDFQTILKYNTFYTGIKIDYVNINIDYMNKTYICDTNEKVHCLTNNGLVPNSIKTWFIPVYFNGIEDE